MLILVIVTSKCFVHDKAVSLQDLQKQLFKCAFSFFLFLNH